MATERVLSNLNLISFKTEGGLQNHIDELQDGDLAFTPDNSLKGVLFDFKWADHLLNDMSWLRADTFSWHSGDVYVVAYNHLVTDFEGTTAETETIGDITITFYRAEDKHKICLPDQEDKLLELYNATGVAWYYILDTVNKQFKLPRTKFGFTGLRDEVGGYVEPSVPNVAGTVQIYSGVYHNITDNITAPFAVKEGTGWKEGGGGSGSETKNGAVVEFDLSTANKTYKNLATVQPPATQMYLYFYVGNFERDAVEQTAGVTVETLNSKAEVDLSNMNASQSAKDTITSWLVPDYSAGVAISKNTDFICPTHGVVAGEVSASSNGYCNIKVNGTVIMQVGSENNQRCRGPFYAQIQKGDVVYLLTSGNADIPQSNFYPFKGVN